MWYRQSKKYNIFGLPISGDMKFKYFAEEDSEDESVEETPFEIPEEETETITEPDIPEEITTDDPTPDDNFSPEDLQSNIKLLEVDPTANIELPPLHSDPDPHCYCKIESRPILSQPGANDALRVWVVNHFNNETGRPINNCPKCTASAEDFNKKEIQRLRNKGINID
jgi:hypothetical protein